MRSARAHVDVEVSLLRLQMRLRAYREAQAGIRAYSPMRVAHIMALYLPILKKVAVLHLILKHMATTKTVVYEKKMSNVTLSLPLRGQHQVYTDFPFNANNRRT